MKQNHNLPHTILDAEYQIIDGEEKLEEGVQKGGVIAALVLGVLGLTALFFPVAVGTGFAFFITVGVFLSGFSQVMLFVQEDKEKRSGWMLANGILLVAAAGLTLLGALMGELGILQMIASVSFLMGVLTMSVGLSQITSALGENRKAPGRGWVLLSGGLNLFLSILMCVNPIVSWFALTTVWGIYLVTAAIALSFMLWSTRRRPHISSEI